MNPPSMILRSAVLSLALLASACSSDTSPEGAVAPSARASETAEPLASDPVETFAGACLASTNWDRAMCTCAGRMADRDLSAPARDFVIATLQEDEAATERLRQGLSVEEATQSALFMVHAGSACGAEAGP